MFLRTVVRTLKSSVNRQGVAAGMQWALAVLQLPGVIIYALS